MEHIGEVIGGASGPFPHALLFFFISALVTWGIKEVYGVSILMVVWSILTEVLQLNFPHVFDFNVTDIWWNLTGSAGGIFIVQAIFKPKNGIYIKNLNQQQGKDQVNGDNTRQTLHLES